MFPNPQDALPLPPRPNLEQYKKLAKELVKAGKSGEPDAISTWATQWVENLVKLSGLVITQHLPVRIQSWANQVEKFAGSRLSKSKKKKPGLAEAQFVIARCHGFTSWPKLAKHIEGLARASSSVSSFEAAADAIITGDAATLQRLLRAHPELIRARSTREHGATLLHYVSANGVEGYRQKTPKNIVRIAQLLLQAGAEVDAEADVYAGGCTALGLAATSAHPRRTGVQNELMQVLLDAGAQIEQQGIAGDDQGAVMSCLANGCPEAAEYLAQTGARLGLAEAAGLGRLDVVKTFVGGRAGEPGVSADMVNEAFRYACGYGQTATAAFLLASGADVANHSGDGQTGLHYAAIGGHLETIRMLLQHNPPLEAKNMYGGTVLGQTLWSAAHGGDPDVYIAMIEALIAAGAKVPERHPPVNQGVDAVLRRYGSEADESWHWYGEKPRRAKP